MIRTDDWSNFDNPNCKLTSLSPPSIRKWSIIFYFIYLFQVIHLNESLAIKIAQQNVEELTQRNKHFMTQITPDISRIDSSNLDPFEFWNCGVQLISMNYQACSQ